MSKVCASSQPQLPAFNPAPSSSTSPSTQHTLHPNPHPQKLAYYPPISHPHPTAPISPPLHTLTLINPPPPSKGASLTAKVPIPAYPTYVSHCSFPKREKWAVSDAGNRLLRCGRCGLKRLEGGELPRRDWMIWYVRLDWSVTLEQSLI